MKLHLILLLVLVTVFSSCMKEDEAIVLPPPGDMQQMVAVMGNNYDNQVYVSLSRQTVVSRPYRAYDLAFETSSGNLRIWTNSGKVMQAARSGQFDMTQADSAGKYWWVDQEQHHPDSSAIGNWWLNTQNGMSEVLIIDRGQTDFSGNNRYRKLQVLSVTDSVFHIRYSMYDNTGLQEFFIPRNERYSLVYFSFDNNGQLVDQAPPRDEWDFVFTKYTHVYFEFPPGSIFRNYPVAGVQLNIWQNTHALQLQQDTFPNYMPFDEFTYSSVSNYNWSPASDVIGYDWKYYDFNNSRYYVYPNNYFIVCDNNGVYYKLRMLDFYGPDGFKGTVTFEFQRI